MTEEEIAEIKSRYSYYPKTDKLQKNTAVYHVRILLEEVDRLKKLTEQ